MSSDFLQDVLRKHIGASVVLRHSTFVSGGCINNTVKLTSSAGVFFLKWKANEPDLFIKEQKGLELLGIKSPIHVPDVISASDHEGKNYLLLEFIESGQRSSNFWECFGENLAKQHKISNQHFGLDHDNHIGRLPQINPYKASWPEFFIENRLEPLIQMAVQKGFVNHDLSERFSRFFNRLDEMVPEEPPALLHGDLWIGNFMVGIDGNAVIFDPAVYYGHRETEIAFTKMFGGFNPEFYDSYIQEYPLESGFQGRVDIHNLYPLLVHLNLFGLSYLNEIKQILRQF